MTTTFLLLLIGFLLAAGFSAFALQSLREHEPRAACWSAALALICAGLFSSAAFSTPFFRLGALTLCGLLLAASAAAFFWPAGQAGHTAETPTRRFDERDIMFARARLIPGSREYREYYALRPENLAPDEEFRTRPGLLSPRSPFFDPLLYASPEASFFLVAALRGAVDGPVAPQQVPLSSEVASDYICSLARYYGALDVGISELQVAHVYSHVGRGMGEWGAEIPVLHHFAIAFTVEMDAGMIEAAPRPSGVMESARQYVESGRVAVQLAAAIRALGYSARAHIDGNYQVIAPLVARDAGLGEIGRMGLLMTPRHGPRVRLGVVTTDLPLAHNPRRFSAAVLDFCAICKKCADCCPSGAIPSGERMEIDGALRWRINAGACYRYWCTIGTDCGRCLSVCPFSHPAHWTHNLVRWGIYRSGLFRRAALRLDDLFYGRKPQPKAPPDWVKRTGQF